MEELDNDENEWRSPGCFVQEGEGFRVEELMVEGLSDESWLLDADFFGDANGRVYGWKGGSVWYDRSVVSVVIIC